MTEPVDLTNETISKARDLIEEAWGIVYAEWAGAVSTESIDRDRNLCLSVFNELANRAGFSDAALATEPAE